MASAAQVVRRPARWWPPLALVGVILLVVMGGYVLTGALVNRVQDPVSVGDTVLLFPLSEWEVAAQGEAEGVPAMRLTRGTGSLDTLAPLPASEPDALLRSYVTGVLQPAAERLDVSEEIVRFDLSYGTAARVDYVGLFGGARDNWIEGQVTVVVTPDGRGILYDGWGPEGLFGYSLGDIETMIERAEVV